jgi:hypothetical protein
LLDPKAKAVIPSQAGISPTHIAGYTPNIVPLTSLPLGPDDIFEPLLQSTYGCSMNENERRYSRIMANHQIDNHHDNHNNNTSNDDDENQHLFTEAEKEVAEMLYQQICCVKTIKNCDWTSFLDRFHHPYIKTSCQQLLHDDRPTTSASSQSIPTNHHDEHKEKTKHGMIHDNNDKNRFNHHHRSSNR